MEQILQLITRRMNDLFEIDEDTLHYLRSSCGLDTPGEVAAYIGSGDDSGAVIDMVSYPRDSFRESIESLIPRDGLTEPEMAGIEEKLSGRKSIIRIGHAGREIYLSSDESVYFCRRFVQRLGLTRSFEYLRGANSFYESGEFFGIRAILRKMKFQSSEDSLIFLNELIDTSSGIKKGPSMELSYLVEVLAGFLNDKNGDPVDLLAGKKFFYENALQERDEFTRMMKSYSMEFAMMKRIQPPLVPVDEAVEMIKAIDVITSTTRGILLPSIRDLCTDY